MIKQYDYTLCDKDCKEVKDGICKMLGIFHLSQCTDDNETCKALIL